MVDQFLKTARWTHLSDLAAWTVEQAIALQQIPAPTFDEAARAAFLSAQFVASGLQAVSVDALHNVYATLPGRDRSARGVLVTSHTDTVFPSGTDLSVRRDGALVHAPGIGDNSIGAASLPALVRGLTASGILLPCDMHIVATSREEGMGDLGGIRAAYRRLRDRIKCVINIEGLAFGHVYHAGIAVRRLKIAISAEGGHSWLHFGRPSAIHTLVQVGARLTEMRPSRRPRTTFNLGIIEGGQSVNSIAASASLLLDLRSETTAALDALESEVRAIVAAFASADVTIETSIVGDRPAGGIPESHPLVQIALSSLDAVGIRGTLEIGSTDGNIPLADGCPTVTIGITRGGNAHRLDEYIETAPVAAGLKQALLTIANAAADF